MNSDPRASRHATVLRRRYAAANAEVPGIKYREVIAHAASALPNDKNH